MYVRKPGCDNIKEKLLLSRIIKPGECFGELFLFLKLNSLALFKCLRPTYLAYL